MEPAGEIVNAGCGLLAEQEDFGHRDRIGMRNGEQRRSHPQSFRSRGRSAMQPELRRPKRAEHLDVLPQHAARMAGSERFHRGFLRGKPSGEMGHRVAALRTISNLPIREYTAQEPLSVSVIRASDAWDVGDINAQSEDRHASAPA